MGTQTQKNYVSSSLFTSLCWPLEFCSIIKFFEQQTMKCVSMMLNKHWERSCSHVLVVPRSLKRPFHVLILATTPYWSSTWYIPTCSYCIYFSSLLSSSESPSSLLEVPNGWQQRPETLKLTLSVKIKL